MKHGVADSLMWWIALVIGLPDIIGHFITMPFISACAFWLIVLDFALFLLIPALDETMHT